MNKQHLTPKEVVVDLVLKCSTTMPRLGYAAVLHDNLIIATKNHLGQSVSFSLPVNFDGVPVEGDNIPPARFVLFELGPTVWKLAPSILHDTLHAYLTIIGVPEDVAIAWRARRDTPEGLEATS
jgi:hypothetical protein